MLHSKLTVEIAGLELTNPTILAAGILGISGSMLKRIANAGAGAVVTKSIGLQSRSGYSNPTIVDVGCGFLNAMGLPNPGIDEFIKEINSAKVKGVPLIVSIYGYSSEEFVKIAKKAEEAGADALELNLSCPHIEKAGMQIGQDPKSVKAIVKSVKSEVEIPIFTKLTPNVADIRTIAQAAEKGGSDGITAINTIRAMSININTKKPILSNVIGGLSGPAIKPVAVRCVYEIANTVSIPVIGCGGIVDWSDAIEFILAGAKAVQIGTAITYKGLNIFRNISEGIHSYLNKKDCVNIHEIVGMAQKH